MLSLYQICSMQVDPKCHPKGWRVYRRYECCYRKLSFKACQMNHADCLNVVVSRIPRMALVAARFRSLDVLKRLPLNQLDDDTLTSCINVCSDLHCVDYLHSFVKNRDCWLVLKCGKKFLRNAIYMAIRYGWSVDYGNFLSVNGRFNHLLYIVNYCQYDCLSVTIMKTIMSNCTNFSICYFLVKWLFYHEDVDTDFMELTLSASDTALHALRTLTFHTYQ